MSSHPHKFDPDQLVEFDRMRAEFQASLGQVVSVLSVVPRYKDIRLGDLVKHVVDPLSRGRIIIAAPKARDIRGASPGGLYGILIWANVSRFVDRRIRRQIDRGAHPVLLERQDWDSGPFHWLLDVIAPDADAAAVMVRKHIEVAQAHSVTLHPHIIALLGAERLDRIDLRRHSVQ